MIMVYELAYYTPNSINNSNRSTSFFLNLKLTVICSCIMLP